MIYYYSATGNSLAMAKKIAKLTGDSLCHINHVDKAVLDDPVIGIVFPVYFGDVPKDVIRFVKRHTFGPNSYIYGVATCGETIGRCFTTLNKLVKKQGGHFHFGYRVPSIANSTIALRSHIPYPWTKLDREDAMAQDIAAAIKSRKEDHSLEKGSLIASFYFSPLGKKFDHWYFKLKVDSGRCIHCGLCVDLCPRKNIKLGKSHAKIGDHCLHCLACIHHCPVQAITVRGRHVLKEDQYSHPGISVDELKV